ncbi:hypothetical protein ACFPYI_10240 [Halomarina salina]|uniref:PQQ-like domain-containing protein n=1 Tax=Halomarina salina TaxID=1872699 RepID=A0ABD5RM53_9EURY|nr:hypothetical protein [Halomarina salina]
MTTRRDVLRTGTALLAVVVAGCIGTAREPNAADGSVQWDHRFTDRRVSQFRRVLRATDGGFFALGSTAASDQRAGEGFVVRTDDDGTEQWRLSVPQVALLLDAVETPDGGLVAVGNATTRGPYLDGWAVGITPDGTERWHRELSTDGLSDLTVVDSLPDGGFLLGGGHGSPDGARSAWLVTVEGDGSVRRDVADAVPGVGGPIRAVVSTDDGLVLAGATGDGTANGLLADVAADGSVRWTRVLDTGVTGVLAAGDGYVLSSAHYMDVTMPRLTKVDSEGAVIWSYGYTPVDAELWFSGEALEADTDGGYLLAGFTQRWDDPSSATRPTVAKVSADGATVEWARSYGDGGSVHSVVALDDDYALGGMIENDARLLRFEAPTSSDVSLRVLSV